MAKIGNFGRNHKALREDRGLTQYEVAEALNMSIPNVSLWETKGSQPRSKKTVKALCDFYDVPERDLFGYEDGYYARTRGLLSEQGVESANSYITNETADKIWCPPEYEVEGNFFVRVNDESMNNVLPVGALALVDVSCKPKNDEVAFVTVGGTRLIRRIKQTEDVIFLKPDSSSDEFRRQIIDQTDPKSPDVHITGRIVWAQITL